MRIVGISSSAVLTLVWAASLSNAFVVPNTRTHHHHSSSSSSTTNLKARYTPPVTTTTTPPPPIPPPPPGRSDSVFDGLLQKITSESSSTSGSVGSINNKGAGADPGNFLNGLLRDLSSKVESIGMPTLPSLQIPDIQNNLPADQLSSLDELRRQFESLDRSVVSIIDEMAQKVQDGVLVDYPNLAPYMNGLKNALTSSQQTTTLLGALPSSLTILVSALLTYAVVSAVLSWDRGPPPSQPYPANKYDPIAARAYFDNKVYMVVGRGLEILVQSLRFGLRILQDKLNDNIQNTEYQRGKELAELLTRLGPTFIKVGQSLSIRTDLLSPAYIRGLETLQDQVPPFDTGVAKQILEKEWGRPVEAILESMPAAPIAAASLGQVYRAKLKSTGQEVAIKVQRPNIMTQVALDMHLLREIAPIIKRLGNLNSDTVGTVDAWGAGFVDELDYLAEARNADIFMEKVKETSLSTVVFAPKSVEEYSTGAVLVTEWVDGQRLDKSSASDVTVLCSIAMNSYLTMLLEMGQLHCDPHPGNLLRTPDGRLCILDWGMVTRLDPDLQLTLIEHVAHLTSQDYAEIPRDLLLLDFIPADKADLIEDSGVVDILAGIYGAWSKGGGAAAINVQDVINSLQDLTAEKGNLFQIPPYFAYIAKSFSVLEGIGLSNDPNYSIINECLPYVSQRLLTDDEKCGPALSTFIFGPKKRDQNRFVEYDRVEQLVEGFGQYTTSASGALLGRQNSSRLELLEESAEQILDLVFVEKETPLQTILLEQTAKVMASGGRSFFTQVRERSGVLPTGRTLLGTLVDPLGIFRTSPLVQATELDEKTLETTRKLLALAQKQIEHSPNPAFDLSDLTREEGLALASIISRKVWERRGSIFQTSNRFLRQLLVLTAEQLESGERDRLQALPPAPVGEPENKSSMSSRQLPQQKATPKSSSPRLQQARKLLDSYQTDGEEDAAVYDALPAKLKV